MALLLSKLSVVHPSSLLGVVASVTHDAAASRVVGHCHDRTRTFIPLFSLNLCLSCSSFVSTPFSSSFTLSRFDLRCLVLYPTTSTPLSLVHHSPIFHLYNFATSTQSLHPDTCTSLPTVTTLLLPSISPNILLVLSSHPWTFQDGFVVGCHPKNVMSRTFIADLDPTGPNQ